jgi:hypothetical protein
MAAFHPRVVLSVLMIQSWVSSARLTLVLSVMLIWLAIFGAIEFTMPSRALPSNGIDIEPGYSAHLRPLPAPEWSIPANRLDFDAYNLALDRDDEMAIARISAVSEWLPVRAYQEVLVVLVEGDTIQIELLDGPYAGHRGWLKRQQIVP